MMLEAFAKHNKMMKDCSTGKGTYTGIIVTQKKKILLCRKLLSNFKFGVLLQDLTVIS